MEKYFTENEVVICVTHGNCMKAVVEYWQSVLMKSTETLLLTNISYANVTMFGHKADTWELIGDLCDAKHLGFDPCELVPDEDYF